jgi:hypothetical protein
MKLSIPGITFLSERDAGSCVQYSFSFLVGEEAHQLGLALANLPLDAEISVPDPRDGDCGLDARRTQHGFETKRGCHGRYGTWFAATHQEALAWLLPGATAASKIARPGSGAL